MIADRQITHSFSRHATRRRGRSEYVCVLAAAVWAVLMGRIRPTMPVGRLSKESERLAALRRQQADIAAEIEAIEAARTRRNRKQVEAKAVAASCVYRDGTPRNTPKHQEIAKRYAWYAHATRETLHIKPGETGRNRFMTKIRLRELELLLSVRYGAVLPDDDAGRGDFKIVAHHIAHLGPDAERHIIAWARLWCPWIEQEEARAVAKQVIANPKLFSADTLAGRLGLSFVDPQAAPRLSGAAAPSQDGCQAAPAV